MNLYLEWQGGSDLDINVMCGCGIWHGYGHDKVEDSSGGLCFCDPCQMTRDKDEKEGDDGRETVFEHIYFLKP